MAAIDDFTEDKGEAGANLRPAQFSSIESDSANNDFDDDGTGGHHEGDDRHDSAAGGAQSDGPPIKKLAIAAACAFVAIVGGMQGWRHYQAKQAEQVYAQDVPLAAAPQPSEVAPSQSEPAPSAALGASQPQLTPLEQVGAAPDASASVANVAINSSGATVSTSTPVSPPPQQLQQQAPLKQEAAQPAISQTQFDDLVRRVAALEALGRSTKTAAPAPVAQLAPSRAAAPQPVASAKPKPPVAAKGVKTAPVNPPVAASAAPVGSAPVHSPVGVLSEPERTSVYTDRPAVPKAQTQVAHAEYAIYAVRDGIFWYRSKSGEIGSSQVNGRLPDGTRVLDIKSEADGRKTVVTDRGLIR